MLRIFVSLGLLQAATLLVLLLRTKGLALLLGPEQVGLMAVVDRLVALFAQTASLSMGFAALRFLSPLWGSDPGGYRALLGRMRRVLLAALATATIAGAAIAVLAPQLFGRELAAHSRLLVLAFATLPAAGLVPFLQNARAARLEPGRSMGFTLAHATVFAATAVAGAAWAGLAGLYAFYAAGGLLFVAWSLGRLMRAARRAAPDDGAAAPQSGLPPQVWRFSLALWGLAALAPFAALYASYRLLALRGAAAAGWMQAALGLALAVRSILGAANEVFLTPNVNRQEDFASRAAWAAGYVRAQALAIGLAVAPVVLFAEVAVRLLYSAQFAPGARHVTLFVLAETVTLVGGVAQSIVVAMDQMRVHVALNVAAQLLLVAVAWYLVPRAGIAGVGLAMLAAALFLLVAPLAFLRRRFGPVWDAATLGRVAFVLAALAALGALGRLPLEPLARTVPLRLGAWALLAFVLLATGTPAERARLREGLATLRRRATGGSAP